MQQKTLISKPYQTGLKSIVCSSQNGNVYLYIHNAEISRLCPILYQPGNIARKLLMK